MTNWKEQFENKYQSFELETVITKPGMEKIKAFIESLLKEVIDDIPTSTFEGETTMVNADMLKDSLTKKYLP